MKKFKFDLQLFGKIGNKNLYLHKVLTDSVSEFTTDTAYSLVNKLRKVDVTPNASEAVLEGDDAIQERISETTSYKVSVELTDLTPDEMSLLSGAANASNLNTLDSGSLASYFAMSWEESFTESVIQYNKLFKVKFDPVSLKSETKKAGGITFQVFTITGTAILRTYTGDTASVAKFGCCIRNNDANYSAGIGSGWHSTGGLGTLDATAPTVTLSPLNEAVDVVVSANMTWTFSLAIVPSCMTSANFFVFKESDGSLVSGALSIGTSNTVVTFNPTSNLTAATEYKMVCTTNVKSLAGTALAANSIGYFTTAA